MFLILSKIIVVFLQPLFWLVAVLIWARLTKRERRRRRLLSVAVVIAIVFTNPLLLNVAYRLWEVPPVAMELGGEPYEFAIVLGGFSNPETEFKDRLDFTASANRLTQALELYHQGKVKKLIISGGSAAIVGEKLSEGESVGRYLQRIGLPAEDVVIEGESRNTYENAVLTAALLAERGAEGSRCLLISDGFHLRRASACFAVAGIDTDPFTTSYSEHPFHPPSLRRYILPDPQGFHRWQRLFKELLGMLVYRVTGKV